MDPNNGKHSGLDTKVGLVLIGILLGAGLLSAWFLGYLNWRPSDRQSSIQDPKQVKLILRRLVKQQDLEVPTRPEKPREELVKLGGKLFFDQLLSGNRDVACATCHHHTLGLTDRMSLAIGTGADGKGVGRTLSKDQDFFPRNALDLANRGLPAWSTMFWDMRIREDSSGTIDSPKHLKRPESVKSLLGTQVLSPLLNRSEMRGYPRSAEENPHRINELAKVSDTNPREVYERLVRRLLRYDPYPKLFSDAYPSTPSTEISIGHVTRALAAYQKDAFIFLDTPWDNYLRGDRDALTSEQKRGAALFFGKARCSKCHAGNLLSDQQAHNVGVPQIGPGYPNNDGFDYGRYRVTGRETDRFAFRTPPLRNVELTGPWMHNGAFKTLAKAVQHHFRPRESLMNYDPSFLGRDVQKLIAPPVWPEALNEYPYGETALSLVRSYELTHEEKKFILNTLDPRLKEIPPLSDVEFDALLAFLRALSSPKLKMRGIEYVGGDSYQGEFSENGAYVTEPLREQLKIERFPGIASYAGIHLTTKAGVLDEPQAEEYLENGHDR